MIAVDCETSGVDHRINSILSIGAVDMANPDNRFYGECRPWEGAVVEQQALEVNGFDFNEIQSKAKSEGELIAEFVEWVKSFAENKPLMCGQNVDFDRDFVKSACERAGIKTPFNYRVIDVHSI